MVIYIMSMPMGYVVGQAFVNDKANGYKNLNDEKRVRQDYSFLPIMCALLMPFAAIVAIMKIMEGN